MKFIVRKGLLLKCAFCLPLLILLFAGSQSDNLTGSEIPRSIAGEDNIMAVPIQLGRESFGLAMIDTMGQTIWIYEINNRGPAQNRLRLIAARSWKYDRLLEEYNTAEPKPNQVKLLLEKLIKTKDKNVENNNEQLNSETRNK